MQKQNTLKTGKNVVCKCNDYNDNNDDNNDKSDNNMEIMTVTMMMTKLMMLAMLKKMTITSTDKPNIKKETLKAKKLIKKSE